MSSFNKQISRINYKSFSGAMSAILDQFDKEQVWMVEKLLKPDQKFESLQQTFSRWMNGKNPGHRYLLDINQVLKSELNLEITCDDERETWRIESSNTQIEEEGVQYNADKIQSTFRRIHDAEDLYREMMRKDFKNEEERDHFVQLVGNKLKEILKDL